MNTLNQKKYALDSRSIALNSDLVLYNEIDTITRAILKAARTGSFSAVVPYVDGDDTIKTTMTDAGIDGQVAADYYKIWQNLDTADTPIDKARKREYQMVLVRQHFQNLGYSILQRKNENSDTNTSGVESFEWIITW